MIIPGKNVCSFCGHETEWNDQEGIRNSLIAMESHLRLVHYDEVMREMKRREGIMGRRERIAYMVKNMRAFRGDVENIMITTDEQVNNIVDRLIQKENDGIRKRGVNPDVPSDDLLWVQQIYEYMDDYIDVMEIKINEKISKSGK